METSFLFSQSRVRICGVSRVLIFPFLTLGLHLVLQLATHFIERHFLTQRFIAY